EARLAVRRGHAQVQTASLPDGECVRTLMRADHGTGSVHDLTGLRTDLLRQPAARVAVGNEADVMAVRLLRDADPAFRGLSPHDGLGRRRAEREVRVRELL